MIFRLLILLILCFIPLTGIAKDSQQNKKEQIDGRLQRCAPYKKEVQSILIDYSLSPNYYYLMVAESGCRADARSQKGADGFWQLTYTTAKRFGCHDRSNLEQATRAAAKYLRTIQERVDSFEESIYCYNMGCTNYLNDGPTAQAKGLYYITSKLMKEDHKRASDESLRRQILLASDYASLESCENCLAPGSPAVNLLQNLLSPLFTDDDGQNSEFRPSFPFHRALRDLFTACAKRQSRPSDE